ncbi:hypothetical protein Hdeb2414_s0050g00751301 [Helianthus debilis subsp. tardiflorus]
MDFTPKHESNHIPPDTQPDLGVGVFSIEPDGLVFSDGSNFRFGGLKEDLKMNDAGLGWSNRIRVSEVPVGMDSGIIHSIILRETDMVCLGNVLGDNWRSRVLNEKLVSSSDLKVSFSADAGLDGFKVGCHVNLIIEGLGRGDGYDEVCSDQYGYVLEVVAKLDKYGGRTDGKDLVMKEMGGRTKSPQLDPNINVFDLNVVGSFETTKKRKKRSIRNEGLKVKASKVMWDDKSFVKVPIEGSVVGKDEVLPDGACAHELAASLESLGNKGMNRDGMLRSSRRSGFNDNARMFRFSVAALNFSFNPGSKDGKVKEPVPEFKASGGKNISGTIGIDKKGIGVKMGGDKINKRVSMKKLIQEKSAENSPYRISKCS